MIVFFVGTPGSGKSYEAVKKIVDNLRLGRTVCTNVDGMELPECQEYLKSILDMDDYTFRQRFRILSKQQVLQFWKTEKVINLTHRFNDEADVFEDVHEPVDELICPKGSLIVLDEVHKFFNCRDYQSKENKELGDWASTHRHEGYDLVLITQNIEKVDKQVRTLTEWCYLFKKVNFLGGAVKKKYLCYSYTDDDHSGKPLAKNVRTYDQRYFPAYKSYSSADAKEVGFMAHTNILKHPIFYAIPVVICLCLYMFFNKSSFASGDIFGATAVQKRYENQAKENAAKSKAAAPGVPGAPVMKPMSSSQAQPLAVSGSPFTPLAVPEYSRVRVDGWMVENGITVVMINGIVTRLPSPHIQKFYKESLVAIVNTDYFGIRPPSFQSSPTVPGLK